MSLRVRPLLDVIDDYYKILSAKAAHLQIGNSLMLLESVTKGGKRVFMMTPTETPIEEAIMLMEQVVNDYYQKNPMPTQIN